MEIVGTTAPGSALTHWRLVMQSGRTFAQKYSHAPVNPHYLHSFCIISECYKASAYAVCLMTPEAALTRPNITSNNRQKGNNEKTTTVPSSAADIYALKMDEALSSEKLVVSSRLYGLTS